MRKLLVAAALAAFAVAPDSVHAQLAPQDIPLQIPGARDEPPNNGPHGPHGGPGEHGPRRPRLFISPSGEPFRGGNGPAAWFAQADADHDGAITLAEFEADALRAFRLYDANGDGVVDGFEIQAYERERVPEIGEIVVGGEEGERGGGERGGRRRGGRHGGGMGGGMGGDGGAEAEGGQKDGAKDSAKDGGRPTGAGRDGAARYSLLNEPEPLLAADEDVDGKVTLAEWKHATARRFAKLDRAHGGRITLESLKPAHPNH
jgi:hypothetical protein